MSGVVCLSDLNMTKTTVGFVIHMNLFLIGFQNLLNT